jgi:hypothetical protein
LIPVFENRTAKRRILKRLRKYIKYEKVNITKNKSNDNNSKIGLPKVPKSIDEALSDPVYGEIWFKSIFGELDQLSERKTFKKAGHSGPGAKSRLVFDVTLDSNMELKFKTRFVL